MQMRSDRRGLRCRREYRKAIVAKLIYVKYRERTRRQFSYDRELKFWVCQGDDTMTA